MHTTHSNTQYKNESSTVKWAQWDKTQSRELLVCSYVCASIALCTIVAHNIAQNRHDSFPPYPPDNHHISNDVYLREGLKKRYINTLPFLSFPEAQWLVFNSTMNTNRLNYVHRMKTNTCINW